MPTISDDKELREFFLQKLQEKCAPVRTEIHVSDLAYCLRKAFWRRFKNRQLSEQQLIFFLDGHQRHEGLQGLVKNLEHEVEVRRYGIVGHLDLMDKHPVEIKTTRARPNGQKPAHYIRQGAYYCLLTGTDTFSLITQYINDGTLTFENIKFSKVDLDCYLSDMLADRDLLQHAYDAKNVSELPLPQDDWQCGKCEFQRDCHKN
jgi:CRISPR/Cas system-associated exonuclease Cas4 (RecB family)